MTLLITPDEVLEIAFSPHEPVHPEIITDSDIEAAQLKFLAPRLKKLYPALQEGEYPEFNRRYIKPAIAFFVKYQILPKLSLRIGNGGIGRPSPGNSIPAVSSEIASLKRESRETAYLFLKKAFRYIHKYPEEFPEIDPAVFAIQHSSVNGGIIL